MAVLLLAAGLFARPTAGQTPGTCVPAEAEAVLDVNNVRARIFGNGPLFWRGEPGVYHVPKDDSVSAVYVSSLLIGGQVQGEIRTAAARYARFEFWPGPLDDDGHPPADCAPFDRLFEITRADLAAYDQAGEITENLRDWPWHLGAPVVEGDGDPDTYDLSAGDRPALLGDQMFWWVMNDAGNVHESTGSPPLGVEVRGTAFAFAGRSPVLDHTTFYHYAITYKGPAPLEDAYAGLYVDNDLGNFDDDYVGSDTLLHLGYAYNADNFDEGILRGFGYGENPPAIGHTVLFGPLADADGRDNDRDGVIDEPGERRGLDVFSCFLKSGGTYGEPITAQEYYHCLEGRWKNGEPITVGGQGMQSSETTTRFLFPGDPVTGAFWSEVNADGQGTALAPADRRFILSTGPFTMQPGETVAFAFAVVWARGADHLDSVRRLKEDVVAVRQAAAVLFVPDVATGVGPPPVYPLGFAQNYPNPFVGATTIRYSLPQPMRVRLTVYDALGRERAVLVDQSQQAGIYAVPFAAGALPAGVYFYRIELDHLSFTRQMLLVR